MLLSLLSPRKLGQDNLFSQFRQIQSFRLSFELWDFGYGEIVFWSMKKNSICIVLILIQLNKLALLWGEAQLCLPYVCLQRKIAYSYPKVTLCYHSAPEQWPPEKKLLHPKSIPTSQCYNCTLIFNNFEMFRMKIFELKPQTGGVNA